MLATARAARLREVSGVRSGIWVGDHRRSDTVAPQPKGGGQATAPLHNTIPNGYSALWFLHRVLGA